MNKKTFLKAAFSGLLLASAVVGGLILTSSAVQLVIQTVGRA